MWAKLDHVNILKLEGYTLDGDYPSLVSVWAENGTVIEYVKRFPNCDLIEVVCRILFCVLGGVSDSGCADNRNCSWHCLPP